MTETFFEDTNNPRGLSRLFTPLGVLAVIIAVSLAMWLLSPAEVTVAGIGKVSVPATSATFNLTVSVVADSSSQAMQDIKLKITNIKSSLKNINIPGENITETQVSLTPATAVSPGAKGYQALTTLTVKTQNVDKVGDIVVSMYGSGATVVTQPVVSVENQDKLEQEALQQALKEARKSLKETVGFRPIKKIIAIQQASSGNVATSTKTTESNGNQFEVVRAVSVTYRVW